MKNPYQKVVDQIVEAINKTNRAIIELAKRSLTIKEYEDFVKAVEEKEKETAEEKVLAHLNMEDS